MGLSKYLGKDQVGLPKIKNCEHKHFCKVDFDEDIHVISELQNSGAEDSEEVRSNMNIVFST